MADFTWPTELDDARKLLGVVGSFWAETYAGNELVESLLHAKAQHQQQAHLDLLDLLASVSRFKIPVFHKENWTLLTLKESELNSPNLPLFDGTYTFNGAISFDVPVALPLYAWPAPNDLVKAKVVLNQITDSSVTYVNGIDFFLQRSAIWFQTNPFTNPAVRVEDVFEAGLSVDRVAYLWVYRGEFDLGNIYKQFGYVLGLKLTESQRYKEAVNAIYDGLVEGTSARCVEELMSAICDVPLALETETVKYSFSDTQKLWIITDKNVYGFSPLAVPIVTVGTVVHAGEALTDVLRFFDFNAGQVPNELRALALNKGLLASGYTQELVFENKEVALVVTESVDDFTKVEFEISGWPGDVEKFWTDLHTNGIAAGKTLAQCLDSRTNQEGQPTALVLPTTINPLSFLVENVFRGNAFAIVVKPEAFGSEALGLHVAKALRKLIPPQTVCFLVVQLAYTGDIVTMETTGSETKPGYEEEVTVYLGNVIEETLDALTYIEEDVRIFQIGGYCQ